jgi:DNA primase
MDPDDWAKAAPADDLVRGIEGAQPLMEYIDQGISRKCDLNSPSGKLEYVRKMGKYLNMIHDSVEQELYVQAVAQKTGVAADTIRLQLTRDAGGARKAPVVENHAVARDSFPKESLLLQFFVVDPSLAVKAREDGVSGFLADPVAREALEQIAAIADKGLPGEAALLSNELLSDAVRNRLAAEIVRNEYSDVRARKEYFALVRALKLLAREREINSLKEQIRSEPNEENKKALLALLVEAVKEKDRMKTEQ